VRTSTPVVTPDARQRGSRPTLAFALAFVLGVVLNLVLAAFSDAWRSRADRLTVASVVLLGVSVPIAGIVMGTISSRQQLCRF
jgi:hypothetical protein